MTESEQVKKALAKLAKNSKAQGSARFFKTGPGEYAEGDLFIDVSVPAQRKVAREFKNLELEEISKLLASSIHEHRATGLMILVEQFKAAGEETKKKLLKYYLSKSAAVNNWDLVDMTAANIVGAWLVISKDFDLLDKLAASKNMWQRRIAMVATWALIREKKLEHTFRLAEKFLMESHDLMHKAVGWMLREAGKRDEKALRKFLDRHVTKMPRTMLRYAIEKFAASDRADYLAKKKI